MAPIFFPEDYFELEEDHSTFCIFNNFLRISYWFSELGRYSTGSGSILEISIKDLQTIISKTNQFSSKITKRET